jgi:L-ascorbate metabolism protein UlaG (beta-lactamase superfamily)
MLLTKKLCTFLLLLCWCLQVPTGASPESGPANADEMGPTLKWLGTAGWEVQIGQITVLIDPFLTRKEPDRIGKEWKTDEEAVLKAIKRANYIFAGHSHADHIADIPFIAKKFGSKVIGSRTTTNLALTGEREDVVVGSGTTEIADLVGLL